MNRQLGVIHHHEPIVLLGGSISDWLVRLAASCWPASAPRYFYNASTAIAPNATPAPISRISVRYRLKPRLYLASIAPLPESNRGRALAETGRKCGGVMREIPGGRCDDPAAGLQISQFVDQLETGGRIVAGRSRAVKIGVFHQRTSTAGLIRTVGLVNDLRRQLAGPRAV